MDRPSPPSRVPSREDSILFSNVDIRLFQDRRVATMTRVQTSHERPPLQNGADGMTLWRQFRDGLCDFCHGFGKGRESM